MAKRLFDFLFSAWALLLLAPVLLVVALAIRLDSPGPVIFSQTRVGRGGKEFRIHKFRSMTHPAPAGDPLVTSDRDTRITRIGRYLRATKIDELPQLLNVVLGEMSLVGPRPEVPKYVAQYPPQLREKILSVRPGITDETAIIWRKESEILAARADPERAYIEEILPQKLASYARYVDHHSLASDVAILWRTLRALFSKSP